MGDSPRSSWYVVPFGDGYGIFAAAWQGHTSSLATTESLRSAAIGAPPRAAGFGLLWHD